MPIIGRRRHSKVQTWDLADSRAAERLYRKSGIPNLIEGYAATTDILTRLSPFLMVWFFLKIAAGTFDDNGAMEGARTAGSILVGLGLTVGINAYFQTRAGRPWWSLPRRIGYIQMALWFLIPAALGRILGNYKWVDVLDTAISDLLLLGFLVFCSAFGVWSMLRWAFTQIRTHASSVTDVLLKTLPVMLLTTMFSFFTVGTWQVMHGLKASRFIGGLGAFAIFESILLFSSVSKASANMNGFDTWEDAAAAAKDAGAINIPELPQGAPAPATLPKPVRLNIALVVFFAQALQATIVFLVMSFTLVLLGILFIRPATMTLWLRESPHYLFDTVGPRDQFMEVVTAELIKVAFFIGAFASLMFTVGLSNDNANGANPEDVTVLRDSVRHVREALAVRRLREQFGMYDQDQAKHRRRSGRPSDSPN